MDHLENRTDEELQKELEKLEENYIRNFASKFDKEALKYNKPSSELKAKKQLKQYGLPRSSRQQRVASFCFFIKSLIAFSFIG